MEVTLADVARRADEVTAHARAELVQAVRRAASEGMTQAQIAEQIDRSQPEVSRLLRFHGTSPLAKTLRRHAHDVRRLIADSGGRRLRVFGSVATGTDRADSDIDLLFEASTPLSLMEVGRLEQRISDTLGVPVDLVEEGQLRPDLRDRVLREAVAV